MMKVKSTLLAVSVTVLLAVVATGAAMSAQDKYTVKVTNGLAFSEFRGYEGWQTISVSHNGPHLAVILGNPAMIDAYKAGIPGNGKPFPDGAGEGSLGGKEERDGARSTVPSRGPE